MTELKKKCNLCKEEKPLSQFHKQTKAKDGVQGSCKICNNSSFRKYYAASPDNHKRNVSIRAKRMTRERRQKFKILKGRCSCPFCGESEPACLDFHHVKNKITNISTSLATNMSWEEILQEMEKCIVLCANCHRKLHVGKLTLTDNCTTWKRPDDPELTTITSGRIPKPKKPFVKTKKCADCANLIHNESTRCNDCYKKWRELHISIKNYNPLTKDIKNKEAKPILLKPSKEELAKLLWEKPMSKIAEDYSLSENAIIKWAKNYNLEKPPIGYWLRGKKPCS